MVVTPPKPAAASRGKQISNPPLVSTAFPASSLAPRPSVSAISRTFLMMGSVSRWKSTSAVWCDAKFSACPPKPVTSVAACAPYFFISSAPVLFSRDIDSSAIRYVCSISATVKRSRSRAQLSDCCSPIQMYAFVASWVPSGLLRTMADSGGRTANNAPRVLRNAADLDRCVARFGRLQKALHHHRYHHLALLLGELGRCGNDQLDLIDFRRPHGEHVADDVRERDLPQHKRIVDQRVEEIDRLYQEKVAFERNY
uniref:Uncharacterized protein n=1 Tax=Anopheles merus TaxID=30066 RepID=A0A182UZT4_ANOME